MTIQQNNENLLFKDNENWKIVGLANPDSATCYANASMQSLFNLKDLTNKLVQDQQNLPINALFTAYLNKNRPNTFLFKKTVGIQYDIG